MGSSAIIGRTGCPECGFESAHVKRSDKCVYRYCPDCGSQYMAKGPRLEKLLLDKTRLVDAAPAPSASASDASASEQTLAVAAPAPATPPLAVAPVAAAKPAKRSSLFGI